jgi:HSP20 family protein
MKRVEDRYATRPRPKFRHPLTGGNFRSRDGGTLRLRRSEIERRAAVKVMPLRFASAGGHMGTLKPFHLFETNVPGMFKGMLPPLWMDTEDSPPTIKIDVDEADNRYLVKADIPGVSKDDIRVDVDGNMVSIEAQVRREKTDEKNGKPIRTERYVGMMSRAFTLPADVDIAKTEAKYADGVLFLTLPKLATAASHRVAIN